MRPVIGITMPNQIFEPAVPFIIFCVWLCGGRYLLLRNIDSVNTKHIDGLILGGGSDVFPQLFKSHPKENYKYDHERDEMEIAWLKKAEIEHIPVFAICRGAQMMNVMNGGSLHMDVSIAYENAHYPKNFFRKAIFRKEIELDEGSLISQLMDDTTAYVNSIHEQSIHELGKNLEVTAREKNGVVQAIERKGHPFYLGVQFHPEFLFYHRKMRAIFTGLVNAARDYSKSKE